MTLHQITGANSRWAVLWLVKKPGRKPYLIEKEFGSDLVEALRIRDLALAAGKKFVTLRSMNVGFPPPERLRPHYETQVTGYKVVKRKGKKYKKKVTAEVWVIPMGDLNAEGKWWCPYCMKLRRFELRDGYGVDDPAYHCQICNISSRDWHVRKWNPAANRFYTHPPRKRAGRAGNGRKRRRRT